MIELGLVKLANASAAVTAICPAGGFFASLPKDALRPNWTYTIVSRTTEYVLAGRQQLTMIRLQVDAFGSLAPDCITLAYALDAVFNGFSGTLTDPDATVVQGMFLSDQLDFFDDTARSFRRMLEYEVHFVQP
jgi:hypothetical protein